MNVPRASPTGSRPNYPDGDPQSSRLRPGWSFFDYARDGPVSWPDTSPSRSIITRNSLIAVRSLLLQPRSLRGRSRAGTACSRSWLR